MDNECGRNRCKTENSQVAMSLLFQANESRGPQVENEEGYRIQLRARIEAGELVEKAILALATEAVPHSQSRQSEGACEEICEA